MALSIRILAIACFCLVLGVGCDKSEPTKPAASEGNAPVKVGKDKGAGMEMPPKPPKPGP